MRIVREKLRGKTVVSILHRLEAAVEFDRIIVLEEGKVACVGTPEQVIKESALFFSLRSGK